MRYYELAQELDTSTRDVLALAQSEGFEVTSHLGTVPAELEEVIRGKLSSTASDAEPTEAGGESSESTDVTRALRVATVSPASEPDTFEKRADVDAEVFDASAGSSLARKRRFRDERYRVVLAPDEPLRGPVLHFGRTTLLYKVVLVCLLVYLVLNRVIPDRFVLPFGSSIRLYEVVLVLLLGAWAVWIVSEPSPFPMGIVGLAGLSLLALLILTPFIKALDMTPFQANGAERGLVRVLLFTGLFMASYHLARRLRTARLLLGAVIGITALQALLSIWEFLTQTPLFVFDNFAMSIGLIPDPNSIRSEFDLFQRLTGEVRAVATAPHPIVLSSVVALGALIAAVWVLKEPTMKRRPLMLIALALLVFALPVANSRTGFLIVLLSMFPLALLLVRDVPRLIPWSLAGFGMAAVGFFISPRTARLLLNSFTRPGSDPNTQVRLERFDRVPDLMASDPFIGTGYLTHDPGIQIFDNAYNLAAVEVGIIGVALFVSFFISVLGRNWAAYRLARDDEKVLVAGGVIAASALLIGGATFDAWTFDQFFPTALVVMGLAVGTSDSIFRRQRQAKPVPELVSA